MEIADTVRSEGAAAAAAGPKTLVALLLRHRPKPLLTFGAVTLGIVEAALSLLIPLLTMQLVEQISASNLQRSIFFWLGGVFLIQTVMSGVSMYAMSYVGQYVVSALRRDLWAKVLRLPVSFFDRSSPGETMSRITNDTGIIKDFITVHVIALLGGAVSIIGGIALLLAIDWKITLFMLASVPAALLVLWPLGSRMFAVSKGMQDETAAFQGDLGRVLGDIRLVKSSLAEPIEQRQGHARIGKLFRFGMQEARIMSIVSPLMMSLVLLILVCLIGYGGIRVAQGTLSGGALVAIILYMFQIVVPFTQIASFFTQFQKAAGASERIAELMDEIEESSAAAIPASEQPASSVDGGSLSGKDRNAKLVFDQVGFGYEAGSRLVSGISFEAGYGKLIALVGQSGAGKTTLFSLIERFYEPSEGRILYGGRDIRAIPLDEWRSRLAYVAQDSPMMAGTIRHNLTYGLTDIKEEAVQEAVRIAHLQPFVSSLPEGLETEIGERGVKLSGGQRQRLAIARAILRDPELLLLDEATAHLDSNSEKEVQQALQSLMRNRTTFVIAHRLSTIRDADAIIVLENGAVTGIGTHGELLATNALYAKLVDQQTIGSA